MAGTCIRGAGAGACVLGSLAAELPGELPCVLEGAKPVKPVGCRASAEGSSHQDDLFAYVEIILAQLNTEGSW